MTIRKNNILQLKLTNGEEILCEMIDIPKDLLEEEIDDEFEVIVKNCLCITKVRVSENKLFCTLDPWISFQDVDKNNIASLNPQHIIAKCIPSEEVMEQYLNAIEPTEISSQDDTEYLDASNWMERLGLKENLVDIYDSDQNVINFPSGTKH
jgi:hypothetical protein